MKTVTMMLIWLVVTLQTSCVQQHVRKSVTEYSTIEGVRYAEEVSAQSPFETVEMSWSEAEKLMKERNHAYREALQAYKKANKQQPVIQQLTNNVKGTVQVSVGDALKPQSLLKMLNEPVTQIPKQLASLSKIKDLSHTAETEAWQHTATSVDAQITMRENQVKLQGLLRTGALIDEELEVLKDATPVAKDTDPKVVQSVEKWQDNLQSERGKWLDEVRDFFNAEYGDVQFVKDTSGLPTYHNVERPDLTKWERWCQLKRSKELVAGLAKNHEDDKPALPGTNAVKGKLATLFRSEETNVDLVRNSESVRKEVRELIQNWREMKEAQEKAQQLESDEESSSMRSLAQIANRQTIFKLRQQEIAHASQVWMMDEHCW